MRKTTNVRIWGPFLALVALAIVYRATVKPQTVPEVVHGSVTAEAPPPAADAPAADVPAVPVAESEAQPLPAETVPPPEELPADDAQAGAEDAEPEGLVEFAHQLSGLMELAMTSEKDAPHAFDELEHCAADQGGYPILKARLICFANASRLSKQYPSLFGDRFHALAMHNPKLVGLLQTTGLE